MEFRRIRRALLLLLSWAIMVFIFLNLQFQEHPTNENLRLPPHQDITNHSLQANPVLNLLQKLKNAQLKTAPSPIQEEDIISQIQQNLPNLPISYWNQIRNTTKPFLFEPCAEFSSILNLEFNNLYWQTLHSSNGTFRLYGAYYDVRKLSRIGPAIRILGMINRFEPTIKTHCQFWFSNQTVPIIVKTMEYKHIWHNSFGTYEKFIFYRPYLITCQIPDHYHHLVPISVSLVEHVCDTATNNLRVIYNKAVQKESFAVCVKGLDYLHKDISIRLVEWIEMLSILGADKIFFYKLHVHPNISKILDYYTEKGKVEVTPITLPGGQPNLAGLQHMYLTHRILFKRLNELIPYNDCLYRNMYRYEYIVLLDIDEVIMPLRTTSWRELMDNVSKQAMVESNQTCASFNVHHEYFLDDFRKLYGWSDEIPQYMHMLQHVYRSKYSTPPFYFEKCFHNPQLTLILHNHFPIACLGQWCTIYSISRTDAQLHHYRADCEQTFQDSCDIFKQNTIIDTTIWRYKDKLVNRTVTALHALDFFEGT